MNTISTIIFDLGTVLVDIDMQAFRRNLNLLNDNTYAFYKKPINNICHLYEVGKITTQQFLAKAEEILEFKFSQQQILFAWNDIVLAENTTMKTLVEKIQLHYRTAILSNTSDAHWQKVRTVAPFVQEKFTECYLSFELGFAKPDVQIYHQILQKMKVPPHTTLFIDDIPENIEGAHKTGMYGIVYKNTSQLQEELEKINILH